MCLLIASKGNRIKRKALKRGFESNPDGAGFAYHDGQTVVIKKGFFGFDEFYSEYSKIDVGMAHIVHFRLATSGLTDADNCHPFPVHGGAFGHNGIISNAGNRLISDTHEISLYLDQISVNLFESKQGCDLLTVLAGTSNKFAWLSPRGEIVLVNERLGHWIGGIWFSNYSYENYTTTNFNYYPKKSRSFSDLVDDEWGEYSVARDEIDDFFLPSAYSLRKGRD